MDTILKEYTLGDMTARYLLDEDQHAGLELYPTHMPVPVHKKKRAKLDGMVQFKLAGDVYNGAYAPGNTLRNGGSVDQLHYKSQETVEERDALTIITHLRDDRGYEIRHFLHWEQGMPWFRMWNELTNESRETILLEMISSFSLTGISPYLEGDGHNQVQVHRLMSRWSQEGTLLTQSMEELQLDTSWNMESVRCERFGQVGSLPVNRYFPFLAMEDRKNHVFWGVQLAHGASWQMEVYRIDENIAVSGGLADREFGHWMKEVGPGGHFTTPKSIVTVCNTDSIDILTGRLTEAGQKAADNGPGIEQELPMVFNEYCTTWGCPSHENIVEILQTVREKGRYQTQRHHQYPGSSGWTRNRKPSWPLPPAPSWHHSQSAPC